MFGEHDPARRGWRPAERGKNLRWRSLTCRPWKWADCRIRLEIIVRENQVTEFRTPPLNGSGQAKYHCISGLKRGSLRLGPGKQRISAEVRGGITGHS